MLPPRRRSVSTRLPPSGSPAELASLGAALADRRDELVAALAAERHQVPFFAGFVGEEVHGLEQDLGRFVDALCAALVEDRRIRAGDVAFLARSTAIWTERGARLEDIAHGLRVLQRVLYDHVAQMVYGEDAALAAVTVGRRLLELVDVSTTFVADSWWNAGRSGGEVRRELLDTLLAGRTPAAGAAAELAAALGLHPGAELVVLSARAVDGDSDLAAAQGALTRAGRPAVLPLARVTDGELLVLRALDVHGAEPFVAAAERTWRRLADGGLRLAVGVGAPHPLPGTVPRGLTEARAARQQVSATGGILALSRLTPLEWLTLGRDPTAWRLVDPPVRRFLEEDLAAGGVLCRTLEGYLAADLNLKATARALHLHVNSVRYRLGKVEERTGLDLRHVEDLVGLRVALALARAHNDVRHGAPSTA